VSRPGTGTALRRVAGGHPPGVSSVTPLTAARPLTAVSATGWHGAGIPGMARDGVSVPLRTAPGPPGSGLSGLWAIPPEHVAIP